MVTDPGEAFVTGAVKTNVGLCMTENIGITRTCEGVEDTTVAQVDMGVTGNRAFKSTTIDELTLGHVLTVACCTTGHARKTGIAVQIDIGAVFLIIGIFSLIILLTDGTHLAATEDLEHITLVQVDGGAAPDL